MLCTRSFFRTSPIWSVKVCRGWHFPTFCEPSVRWCGCGQTIESCPFQSLSLYLSLLFYIPNIWRILSVTYSFRGCRRSLPREWNMQDSIKVMESLTNTVFLVTASLWDQYFIKTPTITSFERRLAKRLQHRGSDTEWYWAYACKSLHHTNRRLLVIGLLRKGVLV